MRRTLVAAVAAAVLVALSATAALARSVTVNAAENATKWDSSDTCGVLVDDYLDMEVNAYCFGSGRAWFKVKVTDVDGDATKVKAPGTGDCSGISITYKERGDRVTVKIAGSGDFDCVFKRVTVRYR